MVKETVKHELREVAKENKSTVDKLKDYAEKYKTGLAVGGTAAALAAAGYGAKKMHDKVKK